MEWKESSSGDLEMWICTRVCKVVREKYWIKGWNRPERIEDGGKIPSIAHFRRFSTFQPTVWLGIDFHMAVVRQAISIFLWCITGWADMVNKSWTFGISGESFCCGLQFLISPLSFEKAHISLHSFPSLSLSLWLCSPSSCPYVHKDCHCM